MGSEGVGSGLDPYIGRNRVPTKYGSEFTTVHHGGDVKLIKVSNPVEKPRAPLQTRTPGRVYGVLDEKDRLAYIVTYDQKGRRDRQIDLLHAHGGVRPHVHSGYHHNPGEPLSLGDELLRRRLMSEWGKYMKGNK